MRKQENTGDKFSFERIPTKNRQHLRQLLMTAAVGGALIITPKVARAGTTTLSGAQTTPQSVTTDLDPTVIVNTASGFSVNTSTGWALTISGNGAISYDDLNNSPLTASGSGYVGLSITSSGDNDSTPGSVTVNTGGNISGNSYGITSVNPGTGATSITTTGTVSGGTGDGINATNYGTDLTISANNVSGGGNGILANNYGTGITSVTSTGTVTGPGTTSASDGISAYGYGTDLTVTANNVSGFYGIFAQNFGSGTTNVTAHGNVTGTGTGNFSSAIFANNEYSLGAVTVTADNPNATITGVIGIYVTNSGASSATSITTDGIVEGSNEGIYARALSGNTGAITITVDSTSQIRNTSLSPTNSAILTSGTANALGTIQNNGLVLGTVTLSNENDTFNNAGTWNMAGGTSNFGKGTNILNNSGYFLAANTTGTANTTINDIGTVNNTGAIILQNMNPQIGGSTAYAGDVLTLTNGGTGVYQSSGGSLYIDTDFLTSTSDKLVVDSVTLGSAPTKVYVNVVGNNGAPTTGDGIEVVQVNGASATGAFVLGAPVDAGLYSYGLSQGDPDTQDAGDWFLQETNNVSQIAAATGMLPILGSRTALATLSNLDDRQRDVNVLSNGQNSSNGVWARTFGQSDKFNANDANDFGFNTTLWGAQAGIDFLAKSDGTGNRKYAGLYVSYASASGDALQQGTKIGTVNLNATTLGAYYTKYSAQGWYLDAVAQYSWLNGISAQTATDEVNPNGNSAALSLEAGRKFAPDSTVIREVQAQLIDQYTSINNATLDGGTQLSLAGLNAVTGRFGIRLYENPNTGKKFLPWLRANIWNTFTGNSNISSLGSTISTPIGGTSGELQAGFTMGPGESGKWNLYASAGYLFDISGAQYSGWEGTLGIRRGW